MKIVKTEFSYLVTECDLKFGEQITLDGELLIPASVLGKIRAEIINLTNGDMPERIWNVDVLEILDKYKADKEQES